MNNDDNVFKNQDFKYIMSGLIQTMPSRCVGIVCPSDEKFKLIFQISLFHLCFKNFMPLDLIFFQIIAILLIFQSLNVLSV